MNVLKEKLLALVALGGLPAVVALAGVLELCMHCPAH